MRIFDETKKYEIHTPDLEKGYLVEEEIIVKSHQYQPKIKEQGHYEVVKRYNNGGSDLKWVVDIAGKPEMFAYDETEIVQVYIPYTDKELAEKQIEKLKLLLANTDYKAIKFAEGIISAEEYSPIKTQRQGWRDEINSLVSRYNLEN
jgi:hypothetical protein